MASALATSDAEASTAERFTARLSRRGAPVVRTSGRAVRAHAPGRLAGSIGDFGNRLGLSHTSRWALDAQQAAAVGSTTSAPVRPPLNYWPWSDPDDADQQVAEPAPVVAAPAPARKTKASSSGAGESRMDALRKMLGLAEPEPVAPAPAAAPPTVARSQTSTSARGRTVHRGLPRTLTRRASTASGAPGDIAQRMRPQAVDPRTVGTRAAAAPPPTRAQPRTAATAQPVQRAAHWADAPTAMSNTSATITQATAAAVLTNRPGTGSSGQRPAAPDQGRASVTQSPNAVQRATGVGSSPFSSSTPQMGAVNSFDGPSRPPASAPTVAQASSGNPAQSAIQNAPRSATSNGAIALAERPITPATSTPEIRRSEASTATPVTSRAPVAPEPVHTDATTRSNTSVQTGNAATGRRAIFDASSTSATAGTPTPAGTPAPAGTTVQRTQDAPAVRPPSAPVADPDLRSDSAAASRPAETATTANPPAARPRPDTPATRPEPLTSPATRAQPITTSTPQSPQAPLTRAETPTTRTEPASAPTMPKTVELPMTVDRVTDRTRDDQPTTTAARPVRPAESVRRDSDVTGGQPWSANGTTDLGARTAAEPRSSRTIDTPAVRPPASPGALAPAGDDDTPRTGAVRPTVVPAARAADAEARTTTSYRPETAPAPSPATQRERGSESTTSTDSVLRRSGANDAPTTTAYRPSTPAPAPAPAPAPTPTATLAVGTADAAAAVATSTPTNRLTIGDASTDEPSARRDADADADRVDSPSVRPPSNPAGRADTSSDELAPAPAVRQALTPTVTTATSPAATPTAATTPTTGATTPTTGATTPTATALTDAGASTPTAATIVPTRSAADLSRTFDGTLDPRRAVANPASSDDDGADDRVRISRSPATERTLVGEAQPVRPPAVPTAVSGDDVPPAQPVAQAAALIDAGVRARPADRSRLRRAPDRQADPGHDITAGAAARLAADAVGRAAREIAREMAPENVRNDGRGVAAVERTVDTRSAGRHDDAHEGTRDIGSNIGLTVSRADDSTAELDAAVGVRRSPSTRHSYSLIARPPAAVAGNAVDLPVGGDIGAGTSGRIGENPASPSDAVVRRAVEAALAERSAGDTSRPLRSTDRSTTRRARRNPQEVVLRSDSDSRADRRLVTHRADTSRARGSLDQITLGASIARPAGVDRSMQRLTSTTPRPPVSGAGAVTSRHSDDAGFDDTGSAATSLTERFVQRTAAEIAAPALDAAARFRQTLQRSTVTTTALPTQWQPLANAIVGDRKVRISTSAASQAALKAAGKIAATTGDVVHLARSLRPGVDDPLLAHELTHVAAPSPHARFFDDHRDSPEERRAELMADVIRRSPVLPRSSAGSTAPNTEVRRARRPGPAMAPTISRSVSGSSSSSGSTPTVQRATDTVTAAALAARITGGGADQVQRTPSTARPIQRISDRAGQVQRKQSSDDVLAAASTAPSFTEPSVESKGMWTRLMGDDDAVGLNQFIDMIVDQLEDRIGREMERRGGRYRGEF